MCETASLYSVLGTALYLLLHGMILEALVFISLLEEGPLLVVSVVEFV